MLKIATIIVARPQIIKASALSRVMKAKYAGMIEEIMIHTGQLDDDNV
jgi:UDP-GlcNAc3NAcA epimerase